MAQMYFYFFIGALFSVSTICWMLVKQFAAAFAAQGKKTMLFGLLIAVLTGCTLYGMVKATDNLMIQFWLLSIVFLVGGIAHMAVMHNRFYRTKEDNFTKLFIGELMVELSVCLFTMLVFSALVYFTVAKDYLFFPMLMSALFFFVPFLWMHTYRAALGIPHSVFTTWSYPLNYTIDPPEDNENERLLVIGFEIAKSQNDTVKTYFRARAPEGIKLGELFYHFINDYNEMQSERPILFLEADGTPSEWWFSRKTKIPWSVPMINPTVTVKDNRIVENTVIICERIIKPIKQEKDIV